MGTWERLKENRWLQLGIGVFCMVMVANLQYGWTLFVNPIETKYHWSRSSIQMAFSIFVLVETWLIPIEGWFVDNYGPKKVIFVGGLFCAAGWLVNGTADSLTMLYLGAVLSGIGAGAVYGTCVGNAVKWFPNKRGLAAGITAAGFGMGSALTVVPIQTLIQSKGYESAFIWFGLGQGLLVCVASLFIKGRGIQRDAEATLPFPSRRKQIQLEYAPFEMLKSPVFWLMYFMFVSVATGGLIATAQLGPIAKDFKISDASVSMLGLTMPALTFALTLDRIMNGLTRPFFGWVSDKIGREMTMMIAFSLEAAGIFALSIFGKDPIAFVVLTGLVFFAWGEIYSLFPSTCTDTYGPKYAATNTGLLYTAKGTASLIVPLGNVVAAAWGWHSVFVIAGFMNLGAAFLAWFALKPMRAKLLAKDRAHFQETQKAAADKSASFAA